MHLHDLWFVLIAFLWTGYFFLEGFDFGIGILTGILARDTEERGVLLATIGPVWDGNEVWMLTAVGATFAAFPDWYATLCSGFYLPILAVVVCLIVRGVALEYRHKRDDEVWRRVCDRCVFWTSLVCSALWGLVFANMVRGVPIGPDGNVTGGLLDLLHPYALLGALTTLCLFTLHGTLFAALKTTGAVRRRARSRVRPLADVTTVVTGAFLFWTQVHHGGPVYGLIVLSVAVVALVATVEQTALGRDGRAFALSALAVAATVATLFLALFPDVMPSSTDPDWSLTVAGSAASPYTLTILTWVAAFMTPVVLAYQAWTYWVFRRRVG
ncbi:cytochrome d ubiquinol oxidase subunit II [Streptomyces sp. NBC_00162]|uniref:cytochrome d ubiquinol oxidase subunit II n=1 Tax=Streptomyces sp. NBC_00162 TaxID=2903629 RepID=UPI00214B7269|nr:cytochrome d ubiquinol oxidase subunit II [Streptomyces sp. NBC_00162]UUU38601.1 cytochrome d ubiquinol oxidase subunit II [Streptomyces sp. NBC_00162]